MDCNFSKQRRSKKSLHFLKTNPTLCQLSIKKLCEVHCMECVRIRSSSDLYFPAFGLTTELYEGNLRIQSKCGKIRTRKTPNTDTFYAVVEIMIKNLLRMLKLIKLKSTENCETWHDCQVMVIKTSTNIEAHITNTIISSDLSRILFFDSAQLVSVKPI